MASTSTVGLVTDSEGSTSDEEFNSGISSGNSKCHGKPMTSSAKKRNFGKISRYSHLTKVRALLIALTTFVGAMFYYQCVVTPLGNEVEVQVNKDGKLVNISMSPEELALQQLQSNRQSKDNRYIGMEAESKLKSPSSLTVFPSPPPPARHPSPPPASPIKALEINLKPKSVRPETISAYLPVLKPSNGSFLDTLDISSNDVEEKDFLKTRLSIFRQRASVLSYECKIRSNLATPGPLHLIWATKSTPTVVWCPISTPGYEAKQSQAHKLPLPHADRHEMHRVFNNSLRMIAVRHPFSRLISVYRDKMQKNDPSPKENGLRAIQRHIIAKYRPQTSKGNSRFPTFPEFIQYVIDSTERLKTRDDWINKVRWWTPYWAQCNVCASDYNLVMKLETVEEDKKFLHSIIDMTELKELRSPEWQHPQGLMKKYMSQITHRQVLDLQQRYLLDYILFGYTLDGELLSYARA